MEDVQEVFRKTIEYESQKDLQELVLNRRLLRYSLAVARKMTEMMPGCMLFPGYSAILASS